MKISILGYGVFGGAVASHLEKNGHIIYKEEIKDSEIIIVAVPSYAVSDVLIANKNDINNQKIIICSKGFDKSGNLFSEVLNDIFPNNGIYFLYGPTLAQELKNGDFSIMVLAGDDGKDVLKKILESDDLKIELSDDIIGVQVGSALKNIVTIFIGIVEGAGFGQNTQAFIYSYGLKEIQKIGVALGADRNTFSGPSCAGDIFMRSRSRLLGVEIGKGRSFEDLDKEIKYPKEGINSLRILLDMKKDNLDLRFFQLVNSVIFENYSIKEAVKKLIKIN